MAKRTTRSTARSISSATRAQARSGPKPNKVMDGLQNVFSGLGTEKDKAFNTFFQMNIMDQTQLDMAYRGDWISRKGIDIPAYDSTREWRAWQADPDDVTLIEDEEKKFNVQLKLMRAMILGRLYGGGAMIIGVEDGLDPEEELDIERVGEGSLKFLHTVSRYQLTTGPLEYDITSPWFGKPQWYSPARTGTNSTLSSSVKLHPSRVITFVGNEIPDPYVSQGWGDSVLQSVSDAILAAGVVSASTAQMVSEAKLDVIKIPGLSENIISDEYTENLRKRFGFANIAKSVYGIILLDAAEEWERIQSNFAGLPDVMKMYFLTASGAFDIPATRFLAQSPQGMSATGESDTRNYYDRLATDQKVFVEPAIVPLDKIIMRSAMGEVPDDEMRDMWYEWNPLWLMTETEKAANDKSKADTFKIDVDAGLLNEVVLKKAREAQLIADGTYPGLKQLIDDFDDDPELENAAAEAEAMLNAPPVTDPNDPNYDPAKDPNSPDFKQVPNAPPKQLAPPKAQPPKALAPPKKKTANADAVGGMVQRIRDAMRPRPLYVRRDLVNSGDIQKWAAKQGIKSVLPDLHVTILYSKAAVDWLKIGADEYRSEPDGGLIVKAGGPRVMQRFGKALVLCFSNSDIQYRHRSMMYRGEEDGISYDYPEYQPHVTITYEGEALDVDALEGYNGELRFGPEIFQEIKGSYTPGKEKKVGDEKSLSQIIADMAPPQVHVDVHVPDAPAPAPRSRKRKRTVEVLKHDAKGRPVQMLTTDEDED